MGAGLNSDRSGRISRVYRKLLEFIAIYLFSSVASSTLIFDTGPGAGAGAGYSVSSQQFYAIQFNVTAQTTVTGIQGWMKPLLSGGSTSSGTVALYDSQGPVPGSQLFFQEFQISYPWLGVAPDDGWYGVSGINWVLVPGDYWASFEVRSGQNLFASMTPGVSSPAKHYAGYSVSGGNWFSSGVALGGAGLQVLSVPEPGAISLFFLSILSWSVSRRFARIKSHRISPI